MRLFFWTDIEEKKKERACYVLFFILTAGVHLIFCSPGMSVITNIVLIFLITVCYEGALKKKIFVTLLDHHKAGKGRHHGLILPPGADQELIEHRHNDADGCNFEHQINFHLRCFLQDFRIQMSSSAIAIPAARPSLRGRPACRRAACSAVCCKACRRAR